MQPKLEYIAGSSRITAVPWRLPTIPSADLKPNISTNISTSSDPNIGKHLTVLPIDTEDQTVDKFTKPLAEAPFFKHHLFIQGW